MRVTDLSVTDILFKKRLSWRLNGGIILRKEKLLMTDTHRKMCVHFMSVSPSRRRGLPLISR